jgi:hypothetical protein
MKVFHILLSVYILVLSSLACSDMEATTSKNETAQISSSHTTSHEEEACSPLCICACCGSLAVHSSERIQQKPQEIIFQNFSPVEEKSVIDISLSVWQPPKLA